MISEVLNALLLTYLATEYSIASRTIAIGREDATSSGSRHRRHVLPCVLVGIFNLVERCSVLGSVVSDALHQLFYIPKILVAALLYVVVLFYDCRRVHPTLRVAPFLGQVGVSFVYVLPVYPFLAVLISFGFLFVITVFEFLHLNEDMLNWPIYYGTLYGPFSLVYWRAKQKLVQEKTSLPAFSAASGSVGGGRVLGGSS
jgi:hypothetical protein